MLEMLLRSAMEKGADLAGWAALNRGELKLYSLLEGEDSQKYRSAFVIAKCHEPEALSDLHGIPTERYDQDYRRLNSELYNIAKYLEGQLQQGGACMAACTQAVSNKIHQIN